ncbi:glycosyltransferase family 1 protein [Rhodoferax sp.]|uniref:glycosyltransferase family 4 protein n=1 Tax=Rhodoferax sp. TaxID=50421 RepID=UPI00260BD3FB|nr:glycosyltransferase family 1 protein [Rhodoferax sp.]MDD3935652.1 glycosyltransferase family 1 protein [Rhodoferax sp.]
MTERPPTIWMNVTTSVNWQRPPVGIVRVERSLNTELGKLYGARFRQCVWQDGQFVEWVPRVKNQTTDDTRQDNHAFPKQQEKPVLPPIFPTLPKRQALIAIAQGLLSLMPRRLQPQFNRLLYALRPRVVRILTNDRIRRLLGRIREKTSVNSDSLSSTVPLRSDESTPFAVGDVLISVGLDWDYSYYKEFYALRKQQGVKVVTCCYDLIPVLYPQYCVNDVAGIFTSYFLEVADGSDLVLCISKQSEKDLNAMLDRTGGPRPPTLVFPLGDNVPLASDEKISSEVMAVCRERFILFVSTIERRKNHEVLYRAYHLLCKQGKRLDLPKLVFVGMQGWGVGELLKDIELDQQTRDLIVRLNHVSDTELRVLYEESLFCVFPSLYEGWGLPVGEALSMGKAVICSDRGSLPEVGGDLVRYAEPWNPQVWAEEIYRMATDDIWRRQWELRAKEQYRVRTWIDAACAVKEGIKGFEDHVK